MPAGRPSIVAPETVSLTDVELLGRLFRALADPTRLRILELLMESGELHQMEIVRTLGATQARVSEHLGCLVWCGLVERQVQGRRTLYRVTDSQVPALLAQAKRFMERNEAQIACCRQIDAPAERPAAR